MITEQRQFSRTPIKLSIQFTFPDGKIIEVETWDMSDGGISVKLDNGIPFEWPLNTEVKAQVIGLPVEGPILPLQVVRIQNDLIGLKILNTN